MADTTAPRPVGRPPAVETKRDDPGKVSPDTPPAKANPPYPIHVMSREEADRLQELRAKKPNPDVLPPDVRTEDEEMEFRDLAKKEASAARVAQAEARRPEVRPSPRERLADLKRKGQEIGEGEKIDLRRLEDLAAAEDRVAELKEMQQRTPEEDDELSERIQFVRSARVDGGYDENG